MSLGWGKAQKNYACIVINYFVQDEYCRPKDVDMARNYTIKW